MSLIKKFIKDENAQLSVEYLIMVVFGMMLVVTTGIIVISLNSMVSKAKAEILTYRDNILSNL